MFIKVRALRHVYQGFDGKWQSISYEQFIVALEQGATIVGLEGLDNDYNEDIVTTPHR